jgi:putative SOS response-associated peptidase YedK
MCGRFTLRASPRLVEEAIGIFADLPTELTPRFNISPTQTILAVRQTETAAEPAYCPLKWGLVPSWAKDMSIASSLINARSEGIDSKPSFRSAFKRRRCLIITDGFYEWKAGAVVPAADGGKPKAKAKVPKQPFHIHRPDQRPFAFAGLWEHWDKGKSPVESATIITTSANGMMTPLHTRMPVILDPRDYRWWLSPEPQDATALLEMLKPCPEDWLTCEPVSTAVNNSRHEGPDCLQKIES